MPHPLHGACVKLHMVGVRSCASPPDRLALFLPLCKSTICIISQNTPISAFGVQNGIPLEAKVETHGSQYFPQSGSHLVPTQNATCIICTRCCLPSLRCQPHKPVCAPDHHLRARGLKDAHPYFTPIQKQLLRMFSQGPTGCHGPVAVPPQRVGPWSSGALPPQPILTSVALHTGPARRPTPGKGCICCSFACCFCFATAFFCGSPSVWFFGLLWCMETRRAAVRATAHPPPRTLLPPSALSPSLTLSSEVQCRWTPLLVVLGLFLSYGKKNNQATLQMKQKRTKGSKEMHDGPMQSS